MKVKISKISGESALIIDAENVQAFIVDTSLLDGQRAGSVIELSDGVILDALAYGIDLEVAFPNGIVIDAKEVQRRLYAMGIVSLDDLKAKPSAVNQVLISIINALSAEIYRNIKFAMEDYNV